MTEQDCPCCMDMEMDVGETYDPAFITRHNSTTGRDANDCHPISAITGLQDALDAKMDDSQIDTESLTDSDAKIPSSALTKAELAGKVDTVDGKGLSENDYTDADKAKLDGIEAGAEVNVIETVKVNGSALTPSGKAVDVPVPTKTSDISNDSGFITKAVDDLANYYLKSQTYTRAEIEALLSIRLKFAVVATLPATGEADTIYLVPAASPQTGNVRDEYIYINDAWELIGSTEFVLTIAQDATGIEINGTALQEASASQPGLMTAAQVTALAGKQDALTFDTAPTASSNNPVTSDGINTALSAKADDAVTVHLASASMDDIGTDTKPIIIVNGVAVAVANPLVDTATAQDIGGNKTFTGNVIMPVSSGETKFYLKDTRYAIGDNPSVETTNRIYFQDKNNVRTATLGKGLYPADSTGRHRTYIGMTNFYDASHLSFFAVRTDYLESSQSYESYMQGPSRMYYSGGTTDIVTQGSLAGNPEICHASGNETWAGNKELSNGLFAKLYTTDIGGTEGDCVRTRFALSVTSYVQLSIADFTNMTTCNVFDVLIFSENKNPRVYVTVRGDTNNNVQDRMKYRIVTEDETDYLELYYKLRSWHTYIERIEMARSWTTPITTFAISKVSGFDITDASLSSVTIQ